MLLYFFAINSYYLVLTVAGFWRTLRTILDVQRADHRRLLRSPLTPPVSVLAPAFNEEANVVENVRSLLMLDYPLFEVILVNDGSTDRTLEVLIAAFDLKRSARSFEYAVNCKAIREVYESPTHPNLVVVDKLNGGKADALNAGLNLSLYPLFCAIDTDSILESDALLRLVRPFIEAPGVTIAAGGVVRVANGCDIRAGRVREVRLVRRPLPLIQIVEYLRAFLFGRMGWSGSNSLLIISGAFGLFEKRAAIVVGGYATDTVGEDMELVVRMHRYLHDRNQAYRVGFVPDAICWTEVPESLRVLRRQRTRWQRGLIDTLWRHRQMIGRPKYGTVGLISLPGFAVFEMLSPLIEFIGLPPAAAPLPVWALQPVVCHCAPVCFGAVRDPGLGAGRAAGGYRLPAVSPAGRHRDSPGGDSARESWLPPADGVVESARLLPSSGGETCPGE